MKFVASFLQFFLCVRLLIADAEVPGALSLESFTFDKVVKAFKTTLVKFDRAYAYGKTQDEFAILAKLSTKSDNLMVVEIGVNEYGNRENQDLAERYEIDEKDYPQYRLFKGDVQNPIVHTGGSSHFDLVRFLRNNGIYLGLDGCVEDLDKLAGKFIAVAGNDETRKAVYDQLLETSEKLSGEDLKNANIYSTLMKNILEKSDDFIQKSIDRLTTIVNGKNVAETKKEILRKKVNILKCFLLSTESEDFDLRDEL